MDMRMIYRLIYVSMIAAEPAALPTVVEDILVVSVANNHRDGITGFLLCDGFNFAQALEGQQDKVEACFARIARDPRHVQPVVREIGWREERAFARWSMCGLTLSSRDDALLQPPEIDFDLARVSPGALWQYLTSLAVRHGSELDAEHERLLEICD